MVRTLHATQGEPFQVDDQDYSLVSTFSWRIVGRKNGKGGALTTTLSVGTLLLLEEMIEKQKKDRSAEIDHINGNYLDNRRGNLRIVSRSQNSHYKWKRMALNRLEQGIKCSKRECEELATKLVRLLPAQRYFYLCDAHFASNRRTGELAEWGARTEEARNHPRLYETVH